MIKKFTFNLFCSLLILSLHGIAQVPFANANWVITLYGSSANSASTRTGVAYNPQLNLYYSNQAGVPSYNVETHDGTTGAHLANAIGNIDFRGMWWNPLLNQVEANCYSGNAGIGIYHKPLDGSGYLSALFNVITSPNVQPNTQASGAYDWINNHFIYYDVGNIYRVNRATNTLVSTTPVTGLPVATGALTMFYVGYTGVPGYEIIVYEYSTRRVHFLNGATCAHTFTTQLPNTAMNTNQSMYNVAYTNNRFFIHNYNTRNWDGYQILPDGCDTVFNYITVEVCEKDLPYVWHGNSYNAPGNDIAKHQTKAGSVDCDSITFLTLIVNPSYVFEESDSVYSGFTYNYRDTFFNTSGYYTRNFLTDKGCDSIYNLKLKVIPVVYDTVYKEICQGDSIVINKKYYKTNTNTLDTIIEDWGHRISRVLVKINPLPTINIRTMYTQQATYCMGDTVTLIASGAKQYEWFVLERDSTYKNLISDSNMLATKVFFEKTFFKVNAIDDNNCENVKEFTLIGENCCEIQVPTAFSPNNDGLNDVFRVIAKAQPQKLIVQIYNRIGHLVYYSNSIHDTWKGVDNKGRELATDTYFYNISGQCWDGTPISIKGDITLLR
jgi:gliding motility-associated-like protein